MCASYFALPSASVSTRTTVPPGTCASATAVTLAMSVAGLLSVGCTNHRERAWEVPWERGESYGESSAERIAPAGAVDAPLRLEPLSRG